METVSHVKNILDQIVEKRRESIAHRKRVLPDVALKIAVEKGDPPRDFAAALSRDAYNVIAELKKQRKQNPGTTWVFEGPRVSLWTWQL